MSFEQTLKRAYADQFIALASERNSITLANPMNKPRVSIHYAPFLRPRHLPPSPFPIIPNVFYDICKLNVFIFNEKQRKHQSSKLNLSNNWLSLVSIYKRKRRKEEKSTLNERKKGTPSKYFIKLNNNIVNSVIDPFLLA